MIVIALSGLSIVVTLFIGMFYLRQTSKYRSPGGYGISDTIIGFILPASKKNNEIEMKENQSSSSPPSLNNEQNEVDYNVEKDEGKATENQCDDEEMERDAAVQMKGSLLPWFSGRDAFTPRSWRSSQNSTPSETSFGWVGHSYNENNKIDGGASSTTASSFPDGITYDERRMKLQLEQEFFESTPQPFLLSSSLSLPKTAMDDDDDNMEQQMDHITPGNIILQGENRNIPSGSATNKKNWTPPPPLRDASQATLRTDGSSTNDVRSSSDTHNDDLWLTVAERKRMHEMEDEISKEIIDESVVSISETSIDKETIPYQPNSKKEWEDEAIERMMHARKLASQNYY